MLSVKKVSQKIRFSFVFRLLAGKENIELSLARPLSSTPSPPGRLQIYWPEASLPQPAAFTLFPNTSLSLHQLIGCEHHSCVEAVTMIAGNARSGGGRQFGGASTIRLMRASRELSQLARSHMRLHIAVPLPTTTDGRPVTANFARPDEDAFSDSGQSLSRLSKTRHVGVDETRRQEKYSGQLNIHRSQRGQAESSGVDTYESALDNYTVNLQSPDGSSRDNEQVFLTPEGNCLTDFQRRTVEQQQRSEVSSGQEHRRGEERPSSAMYNQYKQSEKEDSDEMESVNLEEFNDVIQHIGIMY
ncbi:unnamed protein product [Protopolystoma xenopodis]|uniref:Uncharacterized protein n=1 Tax=Protopolystoma xenopodis TaxID=117903 RepID=A0A3S5CR82_9PLAT|nr:unnamed protein product [Protopolystoma xenopodis]